jgi:tetratricopeptide (TPR) repeat protein
MLDGDGRIMFCVKRCCRSTMAGIMAIALSANAHAENVAAAEAAKLKDQAVALEGAGKLAEAEDAYRKAQAAYEEAFGPENPWVAAMLNGIGRVYIKEHRDAEAEPVLKQGLAIMQNRMGVDSVELVAPLTRLGIVYQNTRRYQEALPLYIRAIAILAHAPLSEQVPQLFANSVRLGDVHLALKQFADAGDAYASAVAAADAKGGINQL